VDIVSRQKLERLLWQWPNIAPRQPRTVKCLRELIATSKPPRHGKAERFEVFTRG
jgi:hypothetical protein